MRKELLSAALAAMLATLQPQAHAGAQPLDLNSATQAQLESLDYIGPVLAEAIIRYRDEHDGFQGVEELTEVKGIGSATLEKIRDQLVVRRKEEISKAQP